MLQTDAVERARQEADLCMAEGGECGALMRAKDWSATALGPPRHWPRTLRMMIPIMLASRFAMRILWGPELTLLYNDKYIPVLGPRKHPAAMGRPIEESYRELWHTVGPMFARVMEGETVTLDDGILPLNRTGYLEECYFTLSYSPIRDEEGAIRGVLGVVHETTERVLAERRLVALRQLAASLADAKTAEDACKSAGEALVHNGSDVPFALFYVADDEGREARLVGSAGLEGRAEAAPAVIALADGDAAWPLARVANRRGPLVVDDLARRFGEVHAGPYPEAITAAILLPLTRPGASHAGVFAVAGINPRHALDEKYQDFFELASEHLVSAIANAAAYQQERRRAEALADLDRQKTTFFGNVSHEFRTPLTLMLGPMADALASPSRALSGPALAAAHRNALRLLKLVNSLLEFSRIEAGRTQPTYRPTDLAALTRELAEAFGALADRAGLGFTIDCAPLGQPAYVDQEMWEKIVLNLLSNAFKFTFEGGIQVTLARGDGGPDGQPHAELRVRDTGVGVPEAELPRLFDRFHRVEGTRARTHEGSGIGLALVHELARLHGGTVEVASRVAEGTTFLVRIPLGVAHLPPARVDKAPPAEAAALGVAPFVEEASRWIASDGEGPDAIALSDRSPDAQGGRPSTPSPETRDARVLLVEDNADMREYVGGVLGAHFTLQTASDGEAALRKMQASVPDLVLTDLMMPNLDGMGLIRAIRTDPRLRTVPVILLSARVGEESRVEGLEVGADDYLTKPFSARELVARVRTHIELGRLRARIEAERRAAAEEERSRLFGVFMQAPAAICVLRGEDHVYELANPPYLELIGGRDVVGKPLREALPEAAPIVLPILDRVYTTGEPFYGDEFLVPVERKGVTANVYFNFIYKRMMGPDGQVEGVAVVASDVTDQVQSRKAAERLSRALAVSNRELDQFAYVASHDLKAPLRGISHLSEWIEEGLEGRMAPETKQHMDLLRGRVKRLEALIDGILSYSRAGRTRDRLERFDAGAVLEDTRELVGPAPGAAVVIAGGMPVLEAERVAFQQVFLNLMSNALKHAQRADPRVDVTCADEGPLYHFRVADNGPGIAPEYHEKIWTIFTTLQPRDKVEGTGIGLSIVKKIVESRGGRVAVESKVGEGAVFHVHWPKVSSPDVAESG
jgi:signal transduction histidine kinase/CheY-like chemotaxis protein